MTAGPPRHAMMTGQHRCEDPSGNRPPRAVAQPVQRLRYRFGKGASYNASRQLPS